MYSNFHGNLSSAIGGFCVILYRAKEIRSNIDIKIVTDSNPQAKTGASATVFILNGTEHEV
jgi:hypothetical protein